MQDYGPNVAYRPDDLCRSGLIVTMDYDGGARFERGLVRAEDALRAADPDATKAGLGRAADADEATPTGDQARDAEAEPDLTPLSERLVMDLTAHRTAGLRAALAAAPTVALTASSMRWSFRSSIPAMSRRRRFRCGWSAPVSNGSHPASRRVRQDGR